MKIRNKIKQVIEVELCFVFEKNLVSQTKGRTQAECVREEGADEDTWT